jgi:hypothetical protein
VYRCHLSQENSDGCGGFEDRFAGLFGSAFLALITNMRFLVDWSGLSSALSPSSADVDWTLSTAMANRTVTTPEDLSALHKFLVSGRGPFSTVEKPFVDFEGLSKDTAMIQSVNRLTFRDPAVWEAMSQRRTVFVSTNRDMAVAWVNSQAKKHGWPTPADALLHSTYPLVIDHGGGALVPV